MLIQKNSGTIVIPVPTGEKIAIETDGYATSHYVGPIWVVIKDNKTTVYTLSTIGHVILEGIAHD